MSEQAANKILRVLHVGVANRGTWPLRQCNASTGFIPAALCDLSDTALEQARNLAGLPQSACYHDLDQAIAEAKVDCAIVCTPTKYHVPMAERLIRAKIPVLVEKGMAPDWASAQQLVRTAREHKAIAAVAQNYRYSAAERTLDRAIHDPTFPAHVGPVHLICYNQQRVRPEPRTLNYPFASIWDMSCHHLDSLISWLGPLSSATAHCWRAPWSAYEFGNNTTAHLVFGNGTQVHYIHTHDAARGSLEIQVHGERGAMYVRDDGITFNVKPTVQLAQGEPVKIDPLPAAGEADLLRDFHAYITRGVEPGVSVYKNLETMASCEMMVRSIVQQRTVLRTELDHD